MQLKSNKNWITQNKMSVFIKVSATIALLLKATWKMLKKPSHSFQKFYANIRFAWQYFLSVSTYMNRFCGWLITTMKDYETKEIDFLKNESKTMTLPLLFW